MIGQETTHRSETDQVQKSKYDATADADRLIVEQVAAIAEKRGVPRVQIRTCLAAAERPVTAPLSVLRKYLILKMPVAALSVKLTPEEIAFLEEPYVPHQIARVL